MDCELDIFVSVCVWWWWLLCICSYISYRFLHFVVHCVWAIWFIKTFKTIAVRAWWDTIWHNLRKKNSKKKAGFLLAMILLQYCKYLVINSLILPESKQLPSCPLKTAFYCCVLWRYQTLTSSCERHSSLFSKQNDPITQSTQKINLHFFYQIMIHTTHKRKRQQIVIIKNKKNTKITNKITATFIIESIAKSQKSMEISKEMRTKIESFAPNHQN